MTPEQRGRAELVELAGQELGLHPNAAPAAAAFLDWDGIDANADVDDEPTLAQLTERLETLAAEHDYLFASRHVRRPVAGPVPAIDAGVRGQKADDLYAGFPLDEISRESARARLLHGYEKSAGYWGA